MTGWIDALAMTGSEVAYSAENASHCRNVVVWNVLNGAATLVSGPKSGRCGDDEASGQRVSELAVAGKQVAWIRTIEGNTEADERLFAALIPLPHAQHLLAATRRVGDPPTKGHSLGGLVGTTGLIAANTWATNAAGVTTTGVLHSVVGSTSLKLIAAGSGTVVGEAADSGRIAVLRADGTVAIYSAAGSRLLRLIKPSSARELALRKDYLVVLTKTKTLEIYNSNTGAFIRRWPVPGGAAHLDLCSGIAVYSVWRKLHALQLTTGKDVVLASLKRAVVADEIEGPGVVYAYDSVHGIRDFGNLVFVPLRTVAAAVS